MVRQLIQGSFENSFCEKNGTEMKKSFGVEMNGKILVLVTVLAALLASSLFAQDIKESLFTEANQAMAEAKRVQGDVLAPKNYEEARKHYRDAEYDFQKGRNLENIRKKLRASTVYFKKAIEATKLAQVTFIASIGARNAALEAGAPNFAVADWEEAEIKFAEAARELEKGDVNDAKKKSAEAETLYRQTELNAIKVNYLQETWELLDIAEKQKVKEYAPKTLQNAQSLVRQAEKELNENRYDTDVARNLASQAKYEAKHAIYLNNTIKQMKKQKQTREDIFLMAEAPMQQLASTMDMVAEFDTGFEKPANQMIMYVNTYQDSVAKQAQELGFRDNRIATLDERIAELEGQLGDVAQQQSELQKRMEAQKRVLEQFREVERMFPKEEARVFREGNSVVMRLVGLNFASGKSTIEPQYFSLLTKVQNAISTFPSSTIIVQGHTDSFGGDELNLKLSQERSEAVRQYLLANLRSLNPEDIESVGYGESQPIANNETAEGRTKNRRIDITIEPQLLGMSE